MEKLGATISAQAPWGSETATFTASGLSDNAPQWIALASDMLLNPSFPESELNKLKERMKVQLQQQRSTSGFLLQERFNRAVYGDHPAAVTSATEPGARQNHARHARRLALLPIRPAKRDSWNHRRHKPAESCRCFRRCQPGKPVRLKRRCQLQPSRQRTPDFSGGPAWAPCRPTSRSAISRSIAWTRTIADGGDGSYRRWWSVRSSFHESA